MFWCEFIVILLAFFWYSSIATMQETNQRSWGQKSIEARFFAVNSLVYCAMFSNVCEFILEVVKKIYLWWSFLLEGFCLSSLLFFRKMPLESWLDYDLLDMFWREFIVILLAFFWYSSIATMQETNQRSWGQNSIEARFFCR